MFKVRVEYPEEKDELDIVRSTTQAPRARLDKVIAGEEILALQEIVRRVPTADAVIRYATALVRRTRVRTPEAADFCREWLSWGAGPRASQYLILGGKARAILQGREFVSADDIKAVAHPVLRHRIITNFAAEAEGIDSDKIVDRLLQSTEAHPSALAGTAG